jgi:hypothetical protein
MATTLLYAATVEQKCLSVVKKPVSPPGTNAAPGSRLKRRLGVAREALKFRPRFLCGMGMKCELNCLKWAITPETPTGTLSPAHPSPPNPPTMKIKAITPLGTFVSVEQPFSESVRKTLEEMLTTNLEDLKSYSCVTEEGSLYFGPNVIQNSVFIVLD